jgi:hypothetical protein
MVIAARQLCLLAFVYYITESYGHRNIRMAQTMPRLAVVGPNPFKTGVSFRQEYDDPGADCSDQAKFDDNLNGDVAIGGDVIDLRKAGTYVVKYFCSNGMIDTSAKRTVIVSEAFEANCSTVKVSGDPNGAANGKYTLLSETHDGKPIYKQTTGSKDHHIYYYETTSGLAKGTISVHRWNIESATLKSIRLSHWAPDNAAHDGLRVTSYAREPSLIKETWSAYHSKRKAWEPAPQMSITCSSRQKKEVVDAFTVKGTVELMGYNKQSFTEDSQYDFKVGLADGLDIPVNDVSIIKMEEVEKLFGRRRRLREGIESHLVLETPEGMEVFWAAQTMDSDVEQDILYRIGQERFEGVLYDDFNRAGMTASKVFMNKTAVTTHEPMQGKPMFMLSVGGGIVGVCALAIALEAYATMSNLKGQTVSSFEVKPSADETRSLTSKDVALEDTGADASATGTSSTGLVEEDI